jgi:hypothetical protein
MNIKPFTNDQHKYVKANYHYLKPREMAAHLQIAVERVRHFMKLQGYVSCCVVQKSPELTEDQVQYILDNKDLPVTQLCKHSGASYHKIYQYMIEKGLLKQKKYYATNSTLAERVTTKFERPPAIYSNKQYV